MKIGYVRVSSKDQNPARQIEAMKQQGIEERFIYIDKASGKDFNRQEYQNMKRTIRKGDVLYLSSFDRLGRNRQAALNEWREITEMGVDIVCLDAPELFNTLHWKEQGKIGSVIEDIVLSLLSYMAQEEREKIRQRQAEGIAIAKKEGKYRGRKPVRVNESAYIIEYRKWKEGKQTARTTMQHLNLKPNTFYKLAREYENGTIIWKN